GHDGGNAEAVQAMISAAPASIGNVTVSSRNNTPHIVPNAGIKNVTVIVRAGPTLAISLKKSTYATPLHRSESASMFQTMSGVIGPAMEANGTAGSSANPANS